MTPAKSWVRVVRCEDIPLREGRAVMIGRREIAIFNLGDRFLAVDNRCPHRGGPLADGIVSGSNVVCPLHAWKFNLESGQGVNSASQSSCVMTFATRVEDGILCVEIPFKDKQLDGDEATPAAWCEDLAIQPEATSA